MNEGNANITAFVFTVRMAHLTDQPVTVGYATANGTATAVWEVLAANPNAFDSFEFGVWFSYTGNPATNTPPTTPAGTVSFSFALREYLRSIRF